MILKNLTPHPCHILNVDGEIVTIQPEGIVPQLKEVVTNERELVTQFGRIRFASKTFSATEGLPAQEAGVLLLVSMICKQANPMRADLVSPDDMLRDENRNIIGCRRLADNYQGA